MPKRRKSQAEGPQSPSTVPPPDVPRDDYGRLLGGGGSLNPGGLPKAVAEARKAALWWVPKAIAKAGALLDHANPFVVIAAIDTITKRGLGKDVPASQLPDLSEPPPPMAPGTSAPDILDRLKGLMDRNLARLERQLEDGIPIPEESMTALTEHAKALQIIAAEERELAKKSKGAQLTDLQLIEEVLQAVPFEQLQAAWSRRQTEPVPLLTAGSAP